ncbi:MAG: cation transporter [Inconstantimicrobium porci]|uniref:Heavy metal transport/detoxification protein n=1 Tax=Inconstantimicrobium porci TaxID=2652291 RepID=A0A7X2N0E2_9CLOT|nr:cation transporter [Inconstantimicrobium porci]MDD6771597.1 cation transporter [Inconstantimicrobium porci]MDY5910762.1 cation transporter [Inconstantimicrobium porci]MSR92426.1 heavy metal transport/detoxification protein [Inconstantimicrobium porci]
MKKIMIEGMSCNHCVAHVREALEGLKDSKNIEVSLEGKYAALETSATDAEIKEAIEEEGYDVIEIK